MGLMCIASKPPSRGNLTECDRLPGASHFNYKLASSDDFRKTTQAHGRLRLRCIAHGSAVKRHSATNPTTRSQAVPRFPRRIQMELHLDK
ncbi:hypothetical protein VFPFJ_01796 [Purpureocillium lilacinum]|uniref:Uncharacterized protein n=1 Tax=Purpureocillium lilacinum TaxID=33203 RepID=A0A179HQC2_PURLI|nr:hypothetical protein VFPFJ_01796 [Purpureocillium lilacinum]OAQ71580.1 hypothetical protein VFPBJ_10359 [Purpureocillium lilacinum]OAQ92635.1 hypothetical protein VFPFJ_01796 [Purpureocillium lilacinum]